MILKRLKVQTTLGEATNCYIVEDEETKETMVIDPGGEADKILEMLDILEANVKYIYLTHFLFHINVHTQYTTPSAQLVTIPYKITGPAIVKILQPIPKTCPSFLYSIAGAATELAKPVIGTSAPAPPHLASSG